MLEAVLEKTEGNPLFVEETIRMLVQEDGAVLVERIPDTLQALIAARIDRLQPGEKLLLQRAAVIGRIFWAGAIADLLPERGATCRRSSTTCCCATSSSASSARRSRASTRTASSTC